MSGSPSFRLPFHASHKTFLSAIILAALGAMIQACVVGCERKAPAAAGTAPPPPAVEVAKPVVREVTEWDEYTGRLAAVETVEVRPRVSGYLESIHFKEGQLVKKGDLLFVIDPRPFQATLAATEAEVSSAATRLELARNDAQRAEGLVKRGAISAEELDTRSKAVLQAQAQLDVAKARSEQAKLDVEFTQVRSPIDGRISNFYVTVGNLISGGGSNGGSATLLTSIVSLDPIHCYFDVSEQDYLKYTRLAASGARASSRDRANPVMISLADETQFNHQGQMDFVDNRIDSLTGTMRGRAIFDNKDRSLTPGMFVRLRLLGEVKPAAVLVPDSAIGTDQASRIVYVIDKDNIVRMRQVIPGRLVDGLRMIKSGLDGSEMVVVRGVQRVRPGSPVTPQVVKVEDPGAGVIDAAHPAPVPAPAPAATPATTDAPATAKEGAKTPTEGGL